MENLRIKSVQVVNSTSILVTFTDTLVSDLVLSNISIIPDGDIPQPEVLKISIQDATLSIECQPLTAFAPYYLTFQSVTNHPFISLHGTAIISEDGVSNKYLIFGPIPEDNPVFNYLTSFYKDNIYNISDDQTVVGSYMRALSVVLSQALYDIGQAGNENYLSFTVLDEEKTRGSGPSDRLNEESAYEIVRIGKAKSSANASSKISSDTFPSYPITLQKESKTETLSISDSDELGNFNINSLILNLSKNPVTKVTQITFIQNTGNPTYTYSINTLGYQILDSKYDPDYGSTYYQLNDNQIKLSNLLLDDPLFSLENLIRVDVSYEYKNLGKIINTDSVSVYSILSETREVLPPIENIFTLKHAPIVDSNNEYPTSNGVSFIDANDPYSSHPAFIQEIPFRLNALPYMPGQYAIDYSTSTVYVYGADTNNDGTGAYPPVATYKYRYTFINQVDFVFDDSSYELVALPYGSLLDNSGSILFNYEQVLIPNVDYVANLHVEAINERIENRLVALNALKVKNKPITDIFKIYNETSGEIYSLNRWYDNKVYFKYINPPKVSSFTKERATFEQSINNILTINSVLTNSLSLKIFKITLDDNDIIAMTEDSIGSSINSSATFSNTDVFVKEKWFNKDFDESLNIDLLTEIGQYSIDYKNGILYCAVSNTQSNKIGTISYKKNNIIPTNTHLISTDDIYYQINPTGVKNKKFTYSSFDEGSIIVSQLQRSDESVVNDTTTIYQIYNKNIGYFDSSSFISEVSNECKFVRSLFEYEDLLNNTYPINFANVSSSSGFSVTTDSINKTEYTNVIYDGYDYYINIDENITYLSSNIDYNFSIIRASDGAQLWDSYGTIVTGSQLKLILSGVNTPIDGDFVYVNYTFTIKDLSIIVIDYNKGDLYIDYTSLMDEILISYEYGDNSIDFRQSNIATNSTYYVTYKVGALRDALNKNFGMLVNIPELINVDIGLNRERYRDALTAALSSFIQGPTLSAIKNIGKTISHVQPEIVESAFNDWILGSSILNPQDISTTGSFTLLPAKYGNGVLINNSSQTISMPANSSFRLEEGTFESWVLPQWNGIDNNANLTLTILKDGYDIDSKEVFIGSSEEHPTSTISLNKDSISYGIPNMNKDGVYIYYASDNSGLFDRWYLKVIDGYVDSTVSSYKITVISDGSFYDSKSTSAIKPPNVSIFTGSSKLIFSVTGTVAFEEGITFISDYQHYLLDVGKEGIKSRISIYKDISGYLNFKVIDKFGNPYLISSDVSSWKINDPHFVAISWKLNNPNSRDEMHLFIDGLEVENISKYGQKLHPYLHEKFRAINNEQIIGYTDRDTVGAGDLIVTSGSQVVTSLINFSSYNIQVGDTIIIDEYGFDELGYSITNINGQELTLATSMPLSVNGAEFTINRVRLTVNSDIDIATGIKVTTLSQILSGNDLNTTNGSNIISSVSTNFYNEGITAGSFIRINSENNLYTISNVSNNTLYLDNDFTSTLSGVDYSIISNEEQELYGIKALRPDYNISKDINNNNILTITNGLKTSDVILLKTLGLSYKKINENYYVWSDLIENFLMTRLPPPISLNDVEIKKYILSPVSIGLANSTLTLGTYYSNNLSTYQPNVSQNGRTLSVNISGTNVDFSSPVQVTISGVSGISTITETITFSDYGTLDFANQYISINYINVVAKPINTSKNALSIFVREKYSLTIAEGSGLVPEIRYSYVINGGSYLYSDGYASVRDDSNIFSHLSVGGYLIINNPTYVAGFYKIIGISSDRKSLYIEGTSTSFPIPLTSFVNASYQVLNTTEYRSGLQNGLIYFESSNMPGEEFFLRTGMYNISYNSYTRIQMDPLNCKMYIGSDYNGSHQLNSIIDHVKTYSSMLSDIRYGEISSNSQKSITKDFNSLKGPSKDNETLALISFNDEPFLNEVDYYVNNKYLEKHFYSSNVVNDNFNDSIVITNNPITIQNDGILDTKKEGTIEMWINPMFDTSNDPNEKYYFDAYGAITEEVISLNNSSLKLSSPAGNIINVRLKNGNKSIDYFAGGKIEIDTQNATQEFGTSITANTVIISKPALQIISIKAEGDLSEQDYFTTGSISSDGKTIYLGKSLPYANTSVIITYKSKENKKINTQIIRLNKRLPAQKCSVIVTYLPKGIQGDRISIYKDSFGYVNFTVSASGETFNISAPTRWVAGTWHRVRASYRFNSSNDDLKLFVDGYQYTNMSFGSGAVYGDLSAIMGTSYPGFDGYAVGPISFKDSINQITIGGQFDNEKPMFGLLDNVRISNIFRKIYKAYGEPIDIAYSSNLTTVFPVTQDLYTTYLMDFDLTKSRTKDFATLKNRTTGNFDFTVNIFDSFDIINSSDQVKQILEKLIKTLKPANSKAYITYT